MCLKHQRAHLFLLKDEMGQNCTQSLREFHHGFQWMEATSEIHGWDRFNGAADRHTIGSWGWAGHLRLT